jgi:hypothetical protein
MAEHATSSLSNITSGFETQPVIYTDGQYLANNETWHVEDSPWKALQIAKILNKNRIACDEICEVGCGAGEILHQLSFIYPTKMFFGYEISPQAFDLTKSRQTRNVKFFYKDLLNEDIFSDCLLCIDVFEHVADYMGFIKALKSKATYKIFHIPLSLTVHSMLSERKLNNERATWGHLHFFNRETALATLKDCEYEILDSIYTPHFKDLPSKSTISRLAKKPLQILYSLAPNLFVRLVGGCSLLVLAK